MKLSTQEEYGLRCLIAIARQGVGGSLTIAEMSDIEGISPSHVAKILSILRRSGHIKSTRGQAGGYSLSKPPSQMTLRPIMFALGGTIFGDDFCDRHSGLQDSCAHDADCVLRPLWGQVQSAVDSVLEKYTLADLVLENIRRPHIRLTSIEDRPVSGKR